MSDQKSTRPINLPSYSESEGTRPINESIPSAPYLNYEPPPSYEESLHHHIVAENLNQGIQKPMDSGHFNCQDYSNKKVVASMYPEQPQSLMYPQQPQSLMYPQQPQSLVYPQQTTQFRYGHQNIVPGSQLYMQPPFYPGQQVIIPNVFEDGARFNSVAPPSIPPPPPGIAPNAAQLAVQGGATVVTSQKKSSFLSGGKGAGFTFW